MQQWKSADSQFRRIFGDLPVEEQERLRKILCGISELSGLGSGPSEEAVTKKEEKA